MNSRKGIILSGGTGSRLFPITLGTSKQLLPLYNKPMIYYPLSTLMLAGIKEILIVTTENDIELYKNLLKDGSQFGIKCEYQVQNKPKGLAQAFIIAEDFLGESSCALILGDNLFHGQNLVNILNTKNLENSASNIFVYPVKDASRYGVAEYSKKMKVIGIEEKPANPKSNFAITGLYFFDNSVINKAKKVKKSKRGELEIIDILKQYLQENQLKVTELSRGMAWFDTGTFDSLYSASTYIRTIEQRQGMQIGCPEEIAWRLGWIDDENLKKSAENLRNSGYGEYLTSLLKEK